jgi:hypothetical protein
VRGLSTCVYYSFFIPIVLQTQFWTCATRKAGVVGTSTHPSISNITPQTCKLDLVPRQSQSPSHNYIVCIVIQTCNQWVFMRLFSKLNLRIKHRYIHWIMTNMPHHLHQCVYELLPYLIFASMN